MLQERAEDLTRSTPHLALHQGVGIQRKVFHYPLAPKYTRKHTLSTSLLGSFPLPLPSVKIFVANATKRTCY